MEAGGRRASYALEQLHRDQDPRLAADGVAPLACWLGLRGSSGVYTFTRPSPEGDGAPHEIALAWDLARLAAEDPRLCEDARRFSAGKTAALDESSAEVAFGLDLVAASCRGRRVTDVRFFAAPHLVESADPGAACSDLAASKVRARRLRALGDADDRWEATALFHGAAGREARALEADGLSGAERARGRVEVCGLYLLAKDPVRAAGQWALLPKAAFSPDAGEAPVTAVKALFGAGVSGLSAALRDAFGAGFSPDDLRADQIRAVVESYSGIAELWWALARRSTSPGEAELCRGRALRLDPALADDAAARAALRDIESALSPRLRVEMAPERRGARLSLGVCGRILAALADLFAAFTEAAPAGAVELVPAGPAAAGPRAPVTFEVTAEGLHPFALEELDRDLEGAVPRPTAHAERALLALLREHHARLSIAVVAPAGQPGIVVDAARRRALIEAADAAARGAVDSREIPQADDLERVFRCVERIVQDAPGPPDITPRQISYYRRAAKVLGLLTEADEPTAAGRLIARLGPEDRLRAGVVCFESSVCGDAWIRWSGGRTLLDVRAGDAADFLRASVPGLSKDTAERRAQTLVAWHRALIAHHYATASRG